MVEMSDAANDAGSALLMRVGGVGLNVADIDRSLRFYAEAIGLKVAVRVPAEGPPLEVALTVSGGLAGAEAMVVLARLGAPPGPGAEGFGRLILNTTDAATVAARAARLGYAAERLDEAAAAGRPVWFLTDPDGYRVELFQASAAETTY